MGELSDPSVGHSGGRTLSPSMAEKPDFRERAQYSRPGGADTRAYLIKPIEVPRLLELVGDGAPAGNGEALR
jgi:hypothetical protein